MNKYKIGFMYIFFVIIKLYISNKFTDFSFRKIKKEYLFICSQSCEICNFVDHKAVTGFTGAPW